MIRQVAFLVLSLLIPSVSHAAAWTSHGPAGGSTRALVAAQENPRQIFLASSGGVFRSDDGGASWRDISGQITDPMEIAVAPSDSRVIVVASRSYDSVLHRSDDGGESWRVIGAGLPSAPRVAAIAIDPRDANVVYVGARCGLIFATGPAVQWHESAGLFKSVDGGVSFVNSSTGLQGFQVCVEELSIDPLNPDTLYASPAFGDYGSARSDDAGATWHNGGKRLPAGGVVVDPLHPGVLYGAGLGALVRSADNGRTWDTKSPTVLDEGRPLFIGAVSAIALDPSVPRLFLGGLAGAYRTGDGGESVLAIPGPGRETTTGLLFDSATSTLTLGTTSGVYQSSGWPWDKWRILDTGDRTLPMRTVLPSRRDPATAYAASANRVFVTRDHGRTWGPYAPVLPGYGLDQQILVHAVDANDVLYAIGFNADSSRDLFRFAPGDETWTRLAPSPIRTVDQLFVNSSEPSFVYIMQGAVTLRSGDGGTTWTAVTSPFPMIPYASGIPVVSPADPDVLYASGRKGVGGDFVLFRSEDGGLTWMPKALPEGATGSIVAADPLDADTVYVAIPQGGVYRSRDGGEHWIPLGANSPAGVRHLDVNHDGTVLHAATETGMWELRLNAPRRPRAVR